MRICVLAVALLLGCSCSSAQSFTPVREQKNLSPAALETLQMLDQLNALPPGQWRMHQGDVPHGEAVGLDDTAWPLVTAPAEGSKEATWYRREIEVPKTLNGYDITGARVSFQFRADANGPMPEIIYFNGRRVALGDDLEPIVLFEPARPGDKILVAVKLLHTVDVKRFTEVSMHVEPGAGLAGNDVSARPNPDDVRVQCLAAADLLPALAKPRTDLLPRVEAAVAAIDTNALATGNQQAFDASLRKAQTILGGLHAELAQAKVDMAGNSHIDAAWLWPRSETIDVVRRTFTTALQLMNEYPDYTFTQSAAQYSAWMADKYPELNDQIRQRIKEGRWEIVGGMWVEPDLNLPGGESLVRQILVGQRYFQKEYGVQARIGWNPDSFGYNWQLPQIYKRSGMDYFVTQKMHWNDTNTLPFRLFWWQSPDGSKVLTYFPTDYVHDNVNPTRISADFAESAARNPGTTEMLDLYGIGDHGGGPTRAMLDQADHWIAKDKQPDAAVPTMRYGTAQKYFSDVEGELNSESPVWNYDRIAKGYTAPPAGRDGALGVPTWKDELYFEYHRGIFTSQAKHKANLRRSEAETLSSEKLASLAWLAGSLYPQDKLTDNWKAITFNQFHDLAAGSGIAVIYRDAQKDFNTVFGNDREIDQAAQAVLQADVDTRVKAGVPVMLFNPLGWQREATVELAVQMPEEAGGMRVLNAQNHAVPVQVLQQNAATHEYKLLARVKDLPALGYTVLRVEGTTAERLEKTDLQVRETAGGFELKNGRVSAIIDRKTGCVTSLKDATGAEFVAAGACGNQLQTFRDTPKNYDAWNIDKGTLDTPNPVMNVDSIAIGERGPVRASVRIERTFQSSKFVQEISLEAGADAIVVANDIDWHESHVLLKAAFPLTASGPKATFEIPYGAIERPTTRRNSWQQAQFEVPALSWADLGNQQQGMSVINDSKYGYDALGNTLRLTLLRSPTWPDPEADRGRQTFRYAMYPHAADWKHALTVRRGWEFNNPVMATQVFAHAGSAPAEKSWAGVENANVVLTAMKKAEDAPALVFRMYEWAGQAAEVKLHVPHGAQFAVLSNMMEKPEGAHLAMAADVVTVPIKPFEILTVSVAYPKP